VILVYSACRPRDRCQGAQRAAAAGSSGAHALGLLRTSGDLGWPLGAASAGMLATCTDISSALLAGAMLWQGYRAWGQGLPPKP
jgi:hypothetical protein